MGRVSTGVHGIRLDQGDRVIGMVVAKRESIDSATLLVATETGRGKRTFVSEYRFQHRGGRGVINLKTSEATGAVVAIKEVFDDDELMLITRNGVVNRQRISEIRVIGRNTQGVRLMSLDDGDAVMDVARLIPEDEVPEEAAENEVDLAPADGAVDDVIDEPELEPELEAEEE
jgi:DNA gyrase subunit A